MARNRNSYQVRTDDGEAALPCSGSPSYIYDKMDDEYAETFVEIQYFTDATLTTAVQPTAGTAVCDGAYSERLNWLELANGAADATTSESSTRDEPPKGVGPLVAGRVSFSGIVGATHAIVVYHKHGK